jgi:acyl-CoA thioesterase FadM
VGLRGARFRYEYAIEREGEGELIAEASTGHATVDAETWRPRRLPQSFVGGGR